MASLLSLLSGVGEFALSQNYHEVYYHLSITFVVAM